MSSVEIGPAERPDRERGEQSAPAVMREAQRLWQSNQKTGLRFSKLLRQLYESNFYKQDGYQQFGFWAEVRFPGITASTARQYSRQGAAIIALEASGRIQWNEEGGIDRGAPSVRGARVLATELFKHGPEVMLAIYDAATALSGAAPVNERHVVKAREGMTTPKDQPDPSTYKPELEEEVGLDDDAEHFEEHSVVLDKLMELEDEIDRVRGLVEHEAVVIEQIRLGGAYTKRLDACFTDDLGDALNELIGAWGFFTGVVTAAQREEADRG